MNVHPENAIDTVEVWNQIISVLSGVQRYVRTFDRAGLSPGVPLHISTLIWR
eukprot:jgi/Botrbrau1/4690/Bobra.0218s0012.1